ncbi:hypothetical protein C3L33_07353, partial [Rhododendron williamsianum]
MLLRSSSTPVLGSLLSSLSETPNHHHHHNSDPYATLKHLPTAAHQKLSFHHSGSLNYTQLSINSSPISPSISDLSVGTNNGFRRAQSAGNLEGLIASDPCKSDDEFRTIPKPPKKFISRRPNWSHLETIPSFHYPNARNRYEDDIDSEEEDEDEGSEREEFEGTNSGCFENSMEGEEKYMGVRNRALNVEKQSMGLDEEIRLLVKEHSGPEMYLARGLGVDSFDIGFGGGSHHNNGGSGGGGCGGAGAGGGSGEGNQPGVEEHYKRLVEENPGNPLCLRNYAQFLYESKGDLRRAEEYYSRAILADPKDGDVLSQYAKLVWELHHDLDRALTYFERAVHAAPADSHVHAAYASFLWETEEDEDGDDTCVSPSHYQNGAMASATA